MTGQDFHFLAQMIGGYLHQDMDLEADSVPEAISVFAGKADASTRAGVMSDMQRFLETYDNRLAEEFASRFGHDFTPDEIGQSVGAFFDMVTVLLDDPAAYTKYLD
ncbi:type IV secretory pathway TraG/TraD family ATPase VirD4 [Neorhizobium huautlense]|uniref:Type IV secretory pathway TraG/TraD family ATPase VirD4 n=1 Tax=Neorhizobium huautlense TaxID=67774 RepID=A0ABT9PRH0_9HYPH|nr:contact-dependent growth inhibition system immunity protein [Neorhizobium huautlense]MDP9837058.1 type IV secretory pathway TraG/TraD family ATPase VirD4 [Neorhizobium huautlense]